MAVGFDPADAQTREISHGILTGIVGRLASRRALSGENGVLSAKRGGIADPLAKERTRQPYVARLLLILTSASIRNELEPPQIDELWKDQREALERDGAEVQNAGGDFSGNDVDFETQIATQVRELARQLLERVLNGLETGDVRRV